MNNTVLFFLAVMVTLVGYSSCKRQSSGNSLKDDGQSSNSFQLDPRVEAISVDFAGSTLYVPKNLSGKTVPGVVILHGSEGGDDPQKNMDYYAMTMAVGGHAALKLCWWGCEGRPDLLKEIPIEYTMEAVEWLRQSQYVRDSDGDSHKVGVIGFSRGGEHAAVVASLLNDTEKVAAIAVLAGADYTMGAFSNKPEDYPKLSQLITNEQGQKVYRSYSAWTWQGQSLDQNPIFSDYPADNKNSSAQANEQSTQSEQEKPEFCLKEGQSHPGNAALPQDKLLTPAPVGDLGRIKVESFPGPMFFYAGKRDGLWPYEMGPRMAATRALYSGLVTETMFNNDCHGPTSMDEYNALTDRLVSFFNTHLGSQPIAVDPNSNSPCWGVKNQDECAATSGCEWSTQYNDCGPTTTNSNIINGSGKSGSSQCGDMTEPAQCSANGCMWSDERYECEPKDSSSTGGTASCGGDTESPGCG